MKGTKMDINEKLPNLDLTPEEIEKFNTVMNKLGAKTTKAKGWVKKYGFEIVTGGLIVGGALVAWKFRPNLSPQELKEWYEGVDPESLVNFTVKADALKVVQDCNGYLKLENEAGKFILSPLDANGNLLANFW